MKKKSERFLPNSNILPELYMYMVFVEITRPVLFLAIDKNENLYICSCHCSNGELCEWLVQETTYARAIELLTDKITIRDIFTKDHDNLFVATQRAGMETPTVAQRRLQDLDEKLLPTAGYCMDAEEDEFAEELKLLRDAENACLAYSSQRFQEHFYTIMGGFSMDIVIPALAGIGNKAGFYRNNQSLSISALLGERL